MKLYCNLCHEQITGRLLTHIKFDHTVIYGLMELTKKRRQQDGRN